MQHKPGREPTSQTEKDNMTHQSEQHYYVICYRKIEKRCTYRPAHPTL